MKRKDLPLLIDLIGANQRMRNTFAMVFDGPAKGVCKLADAGKADVVVVDADHVGAREEWDAYRRKHPHCAAIAITAGGVTLPGIDAVIAKPLKVDVFIAAVKRLAAQPREERKTAAPVPAEERPAPPAQALQMTITEVRPQGPAPEGETRQLPSMRLAAGESSPPAPAALKDYGDVCGQAADIDCEDERQVASVQLPVQRYLLEKLMQAAAESERLNRPVAVALKGNPLAVFFSEPKQAGSRLSDELLQRLCKTTYPAEALEMREVDAAAPENAGLALIGHDAMLWKVAAWTYRGRLPEELHPGKRVYLRHWPNLTRLLELPDALRIAAVMVDQPIAMIRVAEALQIPQRHVFAFCGCAHATGLLGQAKRAADHVFEQPVAPAEPVVERRRLGQIMRYLKGLVTR